MPRERFHKQVEKVEEILTDNREMRR